MFGVPHRVLLVSIFGFRVRFEHLLELSCPVVGLGYAHTYQELDLYDDVVLLDVGFESVFLDDLVVGALRGLAEFARAIHPSPEVLRRCNDIIRNIIQAFNQLRRCRNSRKIRMLIISLNLKQRITLPRRGINRLVDQGFE